MSTPQLAHERLSTSEIHYGRLFSWRSFAIRYGIAIATIAVTLTVAMLLLRYSISINLTILVVAALLIPTWYGGKGPGLVVAITFEIVSIASKLPTPDASIVNYVFGHVSVLSVYVLLVMIVSGRRTTEKESNELNATLEQRVADRTAQLQAANKELEAFSYSVSHDLRAPVRHINGFSQALLDDYSDKLDEIGKGYLRELRGASRDIGLLIDDMLLLARIGRQEMVPENIDLTDMAKSVVAALQRDDPERKVTFEIEEGLSAWCDKRLLQILLTNLIGNAWKFTSKKADAGIVVGREKSKGDPVYFVRDNGAGFDMAYVDKLFGAFQRLHSANEFEGNGIGLVTVRRIVNRHGGCVWAEGAVDCGATFFFSLPVGNEVSHE